MSAQARPGPQQARRPGAWHPVRPRQARHASEACRSHHARKPGSLPQCPPTPTPEGGPGERLRRLPSRSLDVPSEAPGGSLVPRGQGRPLLSLCWFSSVLPEILICLLLLHLLSSLSRLPVAVSDQIRGRNSLCCQETGPPSSPRAALIGSVYLTAPTLLRASVSPTRDTKPPPFSSWEAGQFLTPPQTLPTWSPPSTAPPAPKQLLGSAPWV